MSLFTCGIDLGTTFTCVSHKTGDKIESIENENGHRSFPSYVAFTKDKIIVGETARNQMHSNIKNTIYDAKRMIGHKYTEEGVQQDIKRWHFDVDEDKTDGGCLIKVNYKGEEYKAKPQEISSHVLSAVSKRLRSRCAIENDSTIHAVVTVPAYFNNNQRRATIEAGELAGLNVLQIINEPTAAAIAYGYKYLKDKENRKILVYDFGGGTFDVSIIEVQNKKIIVKATGGDTHLGGEDINQNIYDFIVKRVKKVDEDIEIDMKRKIELMKGIEDAKIRLSSDDEVDISSSFLEDNEIDTVLSRTDFDRINDEIFKKTIKIVEKVLNDSRLSKNDIDNVVLVGGSSRIPKVQELLSEFFNGKVINKDTNPDEVVAMGAAILAEDILLGVREERDENGRIKLIDIKTNKILNPNDRLLKCIEINELEKSGRKILVPDESSGKKILVSEGLKEPIMDATMRKIIIEEILTHDIGIDVINNKFSPILIHGNKIPFTRTENYTTPYDYMEAVSIAFNEEINSNEKKYAYIYKHRLPIKPLPKGEVKCKIKMTINKNGILDAEIIPDNPQHFSKCNLKFWRCEGEIFLRK